MTDLKRQQLKDIAEALKAIIFPVLLMFMIWYLGNLNKRFDRWEETMKSLEINQHVIKRDIQDLRSDTTRELNMMQRDIDFLKKNLPG